MSIDVHGATWRTVAERAGTEIERLRNALERDGDQETTIRLRAELRAYRNVLKWPEQGRSEPSEGVELI